MPAPILRYFSYAHLPEGNLRLTSQFFHDLAHRMDERMPESAEKSAGLRKLLEAKDCFVRAALDVPVKTMTPTNDQ